MPTYCGPTNIPPLEAFKMSCPVLISKVYGMPEQLGEAAIYFDPSSPEDMANKIRLLLNNPKLKAEKIALALKHAKNWDHKSFYQLFLNHVLTLVKTE